MHLTNYAINKENEGFKEETGGIKENYQKFTLYFLNKELMLNKSKVILRIASLKH